MPTTKRLFFLEGRQVDARVLAIPEVTVQEMRSKKISFGAICLYLLLLRNENPSYKEQAEFLSISIPQIGRFLRELRKHGYIFTQKTRDPESYQPVKFRYRPKLLVRVK